MVVSRLRPQAARGITASSDCGVLPALLDVSLDLDRRKALPGRMAAMPLGRPDASTHPRIHASIVARFRDKLAQDPE